MSDYARMVRAILTEDIQNLQQTLSDGERINALDDTGRTPLHIAVMHARTAVFAPLVEAGADPEIKSGDYRSANDMAVEKGSMVQTSLKEAERSRDMKKAQMNNTVVPSAPPKKQIPISTRAAEAMRARRRSAGLLGDMA